jgi:hypothetical protein
MEMFKLLTRVFNEQCDVQSIDENKVTVKEPQDVNSTVSIKVSDSDDDDNASSETQPELIIQESDSRNDNDSSETQPELIIQDNGSQAVLADPVVESAIDSPAKGTDVNVTLKDPTKISSGCVQFHTDPDATYNRHKGKGYHVQVSETHNPSEDPDDKPLRIITHVELENANQHDSEALPKAIDALSENGLKPKEMVADAGYGGDANVEYARQSGVNLVSPVPGKSPGQTTSSTKETNQTESDEKKVYTPEYLKEIDQAQSLSFARQNIAEQALFEQDEEDDELKKGPFGLSDFYSDEKGVIKYCPMGQGVIEEHSVNCKGCKACFNKNVCLNCPRRGDCLIKHSKQYAYVLYKYEHVRIEKRRAYQKTKEFREKYRWRSGIEATNSHLARLGLKRLRVRGKKKANLRVQLKALGLNILRTIGYLRRVNGKKQQGV